MFEDILDRYHSKIEYIDKVLAYFEFAKNDNVEDVAEFIRVSVESDKRMYTEFVDMVLSAQQ